MLLYYSVGIYCLSIAAATVKWGCAVFLTENFQKVKFPEVPVCFNAFPRPA
jgi:hypothetical protein